MIRSSFLLLLFAASFVAPAVAQPGGPWEVGAGIKARLEEDGFDHIAIADVGEGVWIAYENRAFRSDLHALQYVVRQASQYVATEDTLYLVPSRRRVPLLTLSVPMAAYRAFVLGEISRRAFVDAIGIDPSPEELPDPLRRDRGSPLFVQPDLVVAPQFAAQFGNFDDPVETQLSLAPSLQLSLWRGMRLDAQVVLPLYNELEPEADYVRPGRLTLNQTIRLPRQSFLSGTVGYFTGNQYGVDLEARTYGIGDRSFASARAGYTGFALYDRDQWLYSDIEVLTWSVGAGYVVFPALGFSVEGSFGRFLRGDHGVRLDLVRGPGEFELSIFGLITSEDANAGFRMAIPIPVERHIGAGPLRVRPAERFDWEYQFRKLPLAGESYGTGQAVEDLWGRLDPRLLRERLAALDGWR